MLRRGILILCLLNIFTLFTILVYEHYSQYSFSFHLAPAPADKDTEVINVDQNTRDISQSIAKSKQIQMVEKSTGLSSEKHGHDRGSDSGMDTNNETTRDTDEDTGRDVANDPDRNTESYSEGDTANEPEKAAMQRDGNVHDSSHLDNDSTKKILDNIDGSSHNITNTFSIAKEAESNGTILKTILFWNELFNSDGFGFGFGRQPFLKHGCPVSTCATTRDRKDFETADMVIFHTFQIRANNMPKRINENQIWVYYNLENPFRSWRLTKGMNDKFNLTVTYLNSPDTDVRIPIGRTYKDNAYELPNEETCRRKSKMVAWIVSDCDVHSTRSEYMEELSKYVEVGVFGKCGNLSCPRSPKKAQQKCFHDINQQYLFYVAMENGYCKDYMTEKPLKATHLNIVPIVLGYVNYTELLPPNSYIDVRDFSSPRHLAEHLVYLSQNIKDYMEYLTWKANFPYILRINAERPAAFCRLCEILHDRQYPYKRRFDMERYWNPDRLCLMGDEEREAVHLL